MSTPDKCPHCGKPYSYSLRNYVCGSRYDDFGVFVRTELCSERTDHAETRKERDELKTTLLAWRKAFGSSQLSHAQARLDLAESGVKRLEAKLTREREKWQRLIAWVSKALLGGTRTYVLNNISRLDAEAKEEKWNQTVIIKSQRRQHS